MDTPCPDVPSALTQALPIYVGLACLERAYTLPYLSADVQVIVTEATSWCTSSALLGAYGIGCRGSFSVVQ